jgi:hypothetical protein
MHDDQHVVRVNAKLAQETLNILLGGSPVLKFKPIFAVSPYDSGKKKLVFAVARNWTLPSALAVI